MNKVENSLRFNATAYGATDAPEPAPVIRMRSPDTFTASGAADAPSLATARSSQRPGLIPSPIHKKKPSTLALGAWNVRTLTDLSKDRPERRTAFVAHELKRLDIDIAALSETRLPDEGQLCETKAGYTFFWKGLPVTDRRVYGVGFAINTALLQKLK